MQEIVLALLWLIAIVVMIVGFCRKGYGGIGMIVLAVATGTVWNVMDTLAKDLQWAVENFHLADEWGTLLRTGLGVLVIVTTLLMRRFRFAGILNVAFLCGAITVDLLFYTPAAVWGLMDGGVIGTQAEQFAVVAWGMRLLGEAMAIAYSIAVCVWLGDDAGLEPKTDEFVTMRSPLPADITLDDILPDDTAPETAVVAEPVIETATANTARGVAPLPPTIRQTGIGAEILRQKRRLDAGEITQAQYDAKKASLLGL